jgi:hypothetical protein
MRKAQSNKHCLFVLGYHERVIIAMEKEVSTTNYH